MRKLLSVLLCVCMFVCLFCPLVSATEPATVLTVDSKTAVNNDTVNISLQISNNTGIMAMTFSVKYDSSVLSFSGYGKGFLTDYTVFDDKANSKINFVNCEDTDVSTNGKFVILQFKVKENAPKGFSAITISPLNPSAQDSFKGCFAKSDSTSVSIGIINGGVTVGTPCVDVPHKFSDYYSELDPTCTKSGLRSRHCLLCGHCESQTVAALGHDFEDFWTVDREANRNSAGLLSRHCKLCDTTTDIMTFELEDTSAELPNKKQSKISQDVLNRLKKFAELIKGNNADNQDETPTFDEPFFTEGSLYDTDVSDARQLIDSRGKINMSLFLEKLYKYLFGNQKSPGIFDLVKNTFSEQFPNFKLSPLILILLILI